MLPCTLLVFMRAGMKGRQSEPLRWRCPRNRMCCMSASHFTEQDILPGFSCGQVVACCAGIVDSHGVMECLQGELQQVRYTPRSPLSSHVLFMAAIPLGEKQHDMLSWRIVF